MSRNTRRMIERLDPFSLPQERLCPLALTGDAPKRDERGKAPDNPRPPRQRKPKAPPLRTYSVPRFDVMIRTVLRKSTMLP